MSVTNQQITEIQMEHFYSNPENVLGALNVAIAEGDEEGAKYLLDQCKRRGVDLGPAMAKEAEKYNVFLSDRSINVSSKNFRVPFTVKG